MAKMKFRPLHDRVVVRRVEADTKTAGGIIIPTPLRKSLLRAKSYPLAQVAATKPANLSRWTSKLATAFCSANGPAQKSRSIG